jgi:hypothetical protein
MELVANIWPIVDEVSSLIQRFAARAYALDAEDSVIASTLKTLANSDFMIARQFAVPERFTVVTEHGTLKGVITVDQFNQHQPDVIEEALKELQSEKRPLQGIGFDSKSKPFYKQVDITFPAEPYLAVTFLLEDKLGNLRIYKP